MPEDRSPQLLFIGAAGTVTGSATLIDYPGSGSANERPRRRILVDCGLYQEQEAPVSPSAESFSPSASSLFPVDPSSIDDVVVTHAHLDHAGYLPRLQREGFCGTIHCTPPTVELLKLVLTDAARIAGNAAGGTPPPYREADIRATLTLLHPLVYGQWRDLGEGIRLRLWNAGHILGSASIEICGTDGSLPEHVVFSGDIGTGTSPLLPPPEAPSGPAHLVVEATYGGRNRVALSPAQRREKLCQLVLTGLQRGGPVLIAAFAIERTQELLADFAMLHDRGLLSGVPIFIDSPLACRVTGIFDHWLGRELQGIMHRGNFHFIASSSGSRTLDQTPRNAVIVASGGMCEGGRIRHHLAAMLPDAACTVILSGYQAPGTLGQVLLEKPQHADIDGQTVALRARIMAMDFYSGHADHTHLLDWIHARKHRPGALFINHGNDRARRALAMAADQALCGKTEIHLPLAMECFLLRTEGAESLGLFRPDPVRLNSAPKGGQPP